MCTCPKCNKHFKNKTGLSCHTEESCNRFLRKIKVNHICPICNKHISNHIELHIASCGKPNKGTGYGWAKGKTYEEIYGIEKAKQYKLKLQQSNSLIGKCTGMCKDETSEKNRREKIRKKINERYADGWQVKCGRCAKIDYESVIAGKIKVDGSWELAVAKYFDSLPIKWIRNTKRCEYFNTLKNKKSTYCPDFYVYDWDCFIEVKGYTTDLDKIKWKQFQYRLEVWDKKKLTNLGIKIR